MSDRVFVVRPEDEGRGWSVARNVLNAVCALVREGKAVEVRFRIWKKRKTSPQNRTLWMWHTEIASQLTQRCREAGAKVAWTPKDVHENIFKPRFMPQIERGLPGGEITYRPMGTSDKEATAEIISAAMEPYIAWIYQQGMEITDPIDADTQDLMRRMA